MGGGRIGARPGRAGRTSSKNLDIKTRVVLSHSLVEYRIRGKSDGIIGIALVILNLKCMWGIYETRAVTLSRRRENACLIRSGGIRNSKTWWASGKRGDLPSDLHKNSMIPEPSMSMS